MAGRPPFDGFNPDSEDIESYLERLQEYFIAYDIKSETETAAKRRAILLTSTGSNVYQSSVERFILPGRPKHEDF